MNTDTKLNELNNKIHQCATSFASEHEAVLRRVFNGMNEAVLGSFYEISLSLEEQLESGVYFLRNKENGLVKIGCAKRLPHRMGQIRGAFTHIGYPADLTLEAVHLCFPRHIYFAEKFFHSYFSKNRIMGEWFDIKEEVIIDILCWWDLDNVQYINKVWVSTSDIESEYFIPITKDFKIDPAYFERKLKGKYYDTPVWFLTERENKLNTILETIAKHKINIEARDCETVPSFLRKLITNEEGRIYSLSSLKTEKLGPELITKMINQLSSTALTSPLNIKTGGHHHGIQTDRRHRTKRPQR